MLTEQAARVRYGSDSRRIVVKIGSALITAGGRGVDAPAIERWCQQIAALRHAGREVVLVSSGAVAAGMSRLGWARRPHALHDLQAAAAIGQMGLVEIYERAFARHGLQPAQVLLTYDDLANRRRYLNARSTLRTLLDLGIVPVVNENDTVSTEELRFGDHDTLAALVVNLIEADALVILTDQAGLYTRDPRVDPQAPLVGFGRADDPALAAAASPRGGALGRGGMASKLTAARRAAVSGAATFIAAGAAPDGLTRLLAGEALGTLLVPAQPRQAARKQWIAGQLKSRGALRLDAGAVRVLREQGKSLLPVGVTAVTGSFDRGDAVSCLTPEGVEIARGLVNYSADECRRIAGLPSGRIEAELGYIDSAALIHRDNLVLV
ncbi:MAG TPA: glutamate 5-kinase [Gammaproteobacteria bacterium]|nr:glutamate 5-kinase [Gammaproteobacteria bacterium]